MTDATIYKDAEGVIKGFSISGHAGYAYSGEDIVCSAISILTTTTVNSVEKFTSDLFSVEVDEESGRMDFSFTDEPSSESKLLLESMVLGLRMISTEYTDFIRINIKEV